MFLLISDVETIRTLNPSSRSSHSPPPTPEKPGTRRTHLRYGRSPFVYFSYDLDTLMYHSEEIVYRMPKQTPTPGTCLTCNEPVTKRTIATHLLKNHQDSAGDEQLLILVDTPYPSPYWLAIVANPDAFLFDLDHLLREVWVECCGHLSSFYINGMEYFTGEDEPEDESDCSDTASMKIMLRKVMAPRMTFHYEYDFGSTTELRLKVVDFIHWTEPVDTVQVVGMNDKPEVRCDICGEPAEYHYVEEDFEKSLCEECSSDDELDECYLLPIVNSPRTGVCGYEGGKFD